MPLTVLNVAYPLAPVGDDTAGGAEQVLAMIDEALVNAGHVSIVLAAEGSSARGELLSLPAPEELDGPLVLELRHRYRDLLAGLVSTRPIDLVHLHGLDFLDYFPRAGPPVLATLHLPPSWYPADVFRLDRVALVCVSESQLGDCPDPARVSAVVPNGVRLDRFHPISERCDYAVALGRICPEKGFHLALDAAARAGIPMILAGEVFGYAAHRSYFEHSIRPRLSEARRFIGPVGGSRKQQLLASARCLLAPSLAPETSSLVTMEALACGTPVIAFRSGALPELIEDGRTGFLVDGELEMAEALAAVGRLDRSECRRSAERRFDAVPMIGRYLDLYGELVSVGADASRTGRH
jgi:glycosyltransferase involved in cell wall biosynthesis